MEEEVTLDSQLLWLEKVVRERIPVSTGDFIDHAARLNLLLVDLDDELRAATMESNRAKAGYVGEGKSVAMAKLLVEASPVHESRLRLEAKRERIVETIRLAKKRTEVPAWER